VGIYHSKRYYNLELHKLDTWLPLPNRDLFYKWLKRNEAEGISYVQLLKYIFSMKQFFRISRKKFNDVTKTDLEDFLLSMNHLKPKTRKIRWYSLKKFFDSINKNMFAGFKIKFEKSKLKLPEQILSEEEMTDMIDSADNLRDKTFMAILYESGCRISEILLLKKDNIAFDNYGAILIIDGKTGKRRVRIVKYANLLKQFSDSNPEGRVFDIKYNNARRILRRSGRIIGSCKRIHPHLLRHSRATHLASSLTEPQMRMFFGWAADSKMTEIYVHLSGRDIDEAILKINGITPKNEGIVKLKRMGIG